jgi:hypothetical protein
MISRFCKAGMQMKNRSNILRLVSVVVVLAALVVLFIFYRSEIDRGTRDAVNQATSAGSGLAK